MSPEAATKTATTPAEDPVAIICGGGSFPAAVADAVVRRGRRPVMFGIKGWADPAVIERYTHHWIALGQVGRFFHLARAEHCRDVLFIGTLLRPALTQIRLDWRTICLLPRAVKFFRGGDDRLLSGVCRRRCRERGPARHRRPGCGSRDFCSCGRAWPLSTVRARQRRRRACAGVDLSDRALRCRTGCRRRRQPCARCRGRRGNRQSFETDRGPSPTRAHHRSSGNRCAGESAEAGSGPPLRPAVDRSPDDRGMLPEPGLQAGVAVTAGSTIIAEAEEVKAAADRAKIFASSASSEAAA